jgi:membrane-associated phospholipid phosphatase
MQNTNRIISKFEVSPLTQSLALLTALLAFWVLPASHKICTHLDFLTFDFLNHSLLYSHTWQLFWGYLNHPNETWLNIIFMIAVNILGICTIPKEQRLRATILFIYCWISFQLVLAITHIVFNDWLQISRFSPSIQIEPWVILSITLNNPDIKVFSNSSFPAGHILVLVFWLQFLRMYCKPWVCRLGILTAVVLTLPRMISGAHWLTDIIFTIVYANVWFYILSYGLIYITRKRVTI